MKKIRAFFKSNPVVSVVRLQGVISNSSRGLDDLSLAPLLEKAFRNGKAAAVALEINCPGGSPAQSSLIGARIKRLSAEHKVPVFAFVEDVAASGGYWLACAADEIFVDRSSMVGSIGVISAGFGFQEAIERYGVERRVHTAGTSKSMMDPFKAEKEKDVERLKSWLDQLHETFISWVKAQRQEKLADNPDLFTGEVYIGQKAVDQGLADGIGHLLPVMKERFGDKVELKRFEAKQPILSRFGMSFVSQTAEVIEERMAFSKFGL